MGALPPGTCDVGVVADPDANLLALGVVDELLDSGLARCTRCRAGLGLQLPALGGCGTHPAHRGDRSGGARVVPVGGGLPIGQRGGELAEVGGCAGRLVGGLGDQVEAARILGRGRHQAVLRADPCRRTCVAVVGDIAVGCGGAGLEAVVGIEGCGRDLGRAAARGGVAQVEAVGGGPAAGEVDLDRVHARRRHVDAAGAEAGRPRSRAAAPMRGSGDRLTRDIDGDCLGGLGPQCPGAGRIQVDGPGEPGAPVSAGHRGR